MADNNEGVGAFRLAADRSFFRLEGGPYHNTQQNTELGSDGKPPKWLHMVDPVGTQTPDSFNLFLDHLEVAIYKRLPAFDNNGNHVGWKYRYWTPPETSKPPEQRSSVATGS